MADVWNGETSDVYDCGRWVEKRQKKFFELPLAKNCYDKLLRLQKYVHFPRLCELTPYDDRKKCVTMEKLDAKLTKDNLPKNWKQQLQDILAILQEEEIIHRDIRPENLMLKNGVIKLIDFGWAVFKDEPLFGPDCIGDNYKSQEGWDDEYSMLKTMEYYGRN